VSSLDVHIGLVLAARRIELGLHQEQLAHAIGISLEDVVSYEAGLRRMSPAVLVSACNVLKLLVPSVFLGFEPDGAGEHFDELRAKSEPGSVIDIQSRSRRPKR
jgi:transcriptional regulator with XRE-family HTH domain